MAYRFTSRSEGDTEQLAAQLARFMVPGTVLTLDGDLGAGKTRFSQAIARGLGVQGIVNSPTFMLIKEYEGAKLPFYHMDVYRLNEEEADELGLDDYFFGAGVTLVEWARLIPDLLPDTRLAIVITHKGESERTFTITPYGSVYLNWCEQLKENGVLQ